MKDWKKDSGQGGRPSGR